MNVKLVIAAAAAAFLAACGGGGGGADGGGSPVAPAAVQITTANAKPVAAHATGTVLDGTATENATGVVGVQVTTTDSGAGVPQPVLLARSALALVQQSGPLPVVAGVQVDQTSACMNGQGSVRISGNVAGDTGLVPGDTVTISAANCLTDVDGQSAVMNGQVSLSVISGFLPESSLPPFSVKLTLKATNLSINAGGITMTTHGDMTLGWQEASATSARLEVSGTALTSSMTANGSTRTTTLRDYLQVIDMAGSSFTATLSATVETNSTLLGAEGGSYAVSTPTALQWSTGDDGPTAGVLRVAGAGGSQLRLTFSGAAATLEVDADGNGSFESSMATTAAELNSLL